MNPVICPYCGNPSKLVSGDTIYTERRDLALLKYYRCVPCDAHVGCHKPGTFVYIGNKKINSDGSLPMGQLADAQLRAARQVAHAVFDPIWRDAGTPRRAAYDWLARQMGLPVERTHIAEFDLAQCRRVVEVVNQAKKVAV